MKNLEEKVENLAYHPYPNHRPDREKTGSLRSLLGQREREWEEPIRDLLKSKKDDLYKAIDTRLSFNKSNPTIDDYEEYLTTLRDVLEDSREKINTTTEEESTRGFLRDLANLAERKLADTQPIYESIKVQKETGRKQEAMTEAQEDYLLRQIELQTDYLQKIYAIGTGLDLADVASHASREPGEVGGSVSLGQGLRLTLRPEVKLELKIELLAEPDNLTLEMGDNLESIKKRQAMINWVAPHEIAHLVEISSDMSSRLFSGEESAPIKSLTDNWRGDRQDLAAHMVPYIIEETTIDAVGYRMLKEYGTANPLDESKPERIASALSGYVAFMDVLTHILDTKADTDEMKARYSLVLLRKIADGEILINEARENNVSSNVITATEHEIKKLRTKFGEFNQETGFIEEGQAEEIIDLCKTYFEKAETVPLVPKK